MREKGGQSQLTNRRSWIPARVWLVFNTWFSSLVVCVSAAATLHVPISKAAWPIVIFCCGLAVALAIGSITPAQNRNSVLRGIAATLLILGAVVVVLWGSLMQDEFVSVFPDPWGYTAHAAYLQNQVPAISDGSQPVLSYGSALMGTRYATPGLLALFAEIFGTDTCRSGSIYAFIVLAQVGFGFVLLSRDLGVGPVYSLGAGLFGVTIGWAPEILKMGNWDQALFVSLMPCAIFRTRLLMFPTTRASGVLGLGLCMAAVIFAYPEGVALAGVIYLPLVVWKLLRGTRLTAKIGPIALASGIAILLSIVYLPTFTSYLVRQIVSGSTVFNAKGVLGGLLSNGWLPAIYCLGPQLPAVGARTLAKLEIIVSALFVALTFVAIAAWWRKKDGILLTIPSFLALSLWQALLVGYDYGFYKVLTIFWPVTVAAIFVGISRLLARSRSLVRPFIVVAFCGLMAGAVVNEVDNFPFAPWRQDRRIRPFLELTKLKEISGDAPIRIQTQSWFNQMWAVFFLQGYKIEIPNPLLYLRVPSTGLNNGATQVWTGTLVLTDEKRTGAIWHNEVFSLLNRSEPVEVLAIEAPNTVETVDGDQFIWLDNQFADFTIRSDADRRAFLVIPECRPGPSRPGDPNRTLILEANGETLEVPAEGTLKIPLALKKGKNFVRLSCKEHATANKLSSGDSRTLLLGIKGPSFEAQIRQ